MLDELRTFVVFAEAGSLHRAAARLRLTPSAVTRQIQRLEAGLEAHLLDRRVKPAVLTPAGRAVLDRSRELLRSVEDLRAVASPQAEPTGSFRLGVAPALAQPSLVRPIQRLGKRFPGLQSSFTSDMTDALLRRVQDAELDMAVVLLPADGQLPAGMVGTVIASERFAAVRRREASARSPDDPAGPWVLNPRGCLLREALRDHLERSGTPLRVAAEVHNLELQLALVAAGVGFGVMPVRFLAGHARRRQVRPLRRPSWEVRASVALVRAAHLGRLEAVAQFLHEELRGSRGAPG